MQNLALPSHGGGADPRVRPALPSPVAVTGVLGFVGSHLLPRLLERGARVIALVRPGRDASRLEDRVTEIRRANLDDPGTLGGAFEGAEAVVHLSGLAQVPGLVAALEGAGVRRGVFVSSAGVRTRLESRSADAKRAGEEALRRSSIGYTILRPSMIYGTPADRNLARLLRWLRACPLVPVPGGGATLQQPVHVGDLVAAITSALERPETERKEYDVGGPEALTLRDLIHACAASVGRRAFVLGVPLGPAHGAASLLRRLGLRSPVRPEQILRLTESKAVDISAARRDLGVEPRSFADGIRAEAKLLSPR